jgi:hypothetical protein
MEMLAPEKIDEDEETDLLMLRLFCLEPKRPWRITSGGEVGLSLVGGS